MDSKKSSRARRPSRIYLKLMSKFHKRNMGFDAVKKHKIFRLLGKNMNNNKTIFNKL